MLNIFLLQPWRRGPAWGGGDGGGGGEGPGDSGGNDGLDAFGGAGADVSVDSGASADAGDGDGGLDAFGGAGYDVDVDTSGYDAGIDATSSDGGLDAFGGTGDDVSIDATSSADVSDADFGMGSIDGVPDVAVSDNIDYSPTGPESPGVPDLGYDFGMSSGTGINVGIGTSAGEEDVDPSGYNIGPSGYISVDAIADTGIDPETNYGDANPNSPNAYFDAFGNAYNTQIEAEVADNVAAGYNDVPDMDGNTFEEYEAEYGTSPDFTNSGDFDPDEYLGGPGDGEGGETTTTTNTLPSSFDRVEYNYNTSLEASPYGGMWSNITSTVPKYEFNAYEDEDGLLRFSDNDEPVPPEILKYLGYAKKTLIEEEEEEEEETEEEAA